MLNDKLSLFYRLVNEAVAIHGLSAPHVADEIIAVAFPGTASAAHAEGADSMLRNGVIAFLARHFKKTVPVDVSSDRQFALPLIPEPLTPIVSRLKAESHYVEQLSEYIPVALLIANPEWLDDARKYKRQKGEETLAEATILDELYAAITEGSSE